MSLFIAPLAFSANRARCDAAVVGLLAASAMAAIAGSAWLRTGLPIIAAEA